MENKNLERKKMTMVKTEAASIIMSGVYGVFGATVHYLYRIHTGREATFKFATFALNGFFGFYIGLVVGNFIPPTLASRDGVLMVAGFLVYQIFDYIEERGLDRLKKKLGIDEKDKRDK